MTLDQQLLYNTLEFLPPNPGGYIALLAFTRHLFNHMVNHTVKG